MKSNLQNIVLLSLIPILFFLFSFFTLSRYGISWDEPIHFTRGQAYLNYFLTGKLDYQNLIPLDRRSLYQDSSFTGQFFINNDSGHPPVNGILAAFLNFIFFQRLGILGDIESYHLFNIMSGTLLVSIVTIFAARSYGLLAGIMAGVSLSLYPLFFGESHFNIKDPAEAAFYAGTIWAFWNSLKHYCWRWLLLSILFFALALGTKFNILFLPPILILWLIWRNPSAVWHPFKTVLKIPRNFLFLLTISWILVGFFFFLTWPYLWQNPLEHTLNIFLYYKEIGTGGLGQPQFLIEGGFNLFPITWIGITTPLVILFLTLIGIISALLQKDKEKTGALLLLWLIVPILRVSFPGSSIYGGIRQIMEFLPAMAILSGLGASNLVQLIRGFPIGRALPQSLLGCLVLLLFIPHLLVMINIYPNENVYFNGLIGGLKGAQKANIPYYGNSFGNAYYQAVQWLNVNAPEGSSVGLLQGTSVNIPVIFFSPKFNYSNSVWSGINRQGEYLVELTHQGNEVAYPFAWEYVNRVLVPVHQVLVDGVPLAKVWKNDLEHSRPEYRDEKVLTIKNIRQIKDALEINLDQVYSLAKIKVEFDNKGSCQSFDKGVIQTSLDNISWRTESEKLPDFQVKAYPSLEEGLLRYILPANSAQSIRIKTDSIDSCLFRNFQIEVRGFNVNR